MNLFRPLALLVSSLLVSVALEAAPAIAASAEAAQPLARGASAPAVKLTAADGSIVDLGKAFAAQPTILVFYRGSWCPYCNKQLAALGEAQEELRKLGYQILAVSPDTAAGLKQMAGKNHLDYQLLSDHEMVASAAYGVAFQVPAPTVKAYQGYGIALTPIAGTDGRWLPIPAVFIIDRQGTIRFAYANPDYKTRLEVSDLLAAARGATGQ
jgi:peroxiredoxin